MKVSFRVWKDLEPLLTKRLNEYPLSLDISARMNMLLKELLIVESKPEIDKPLHHAETSEVKKMVKCPVGKTKGSWVYPSSCRKCNETLCDIKR